jgi:hypothetical protein
MMQRIRKTPLTVLLFFILAFSDIPEISSQARFFQQLNAHKWDVQPHDNSSKSSNIISYNQCHLGLFCNKDLIYKLYLSDSQSSTWKYIPSPHEKKKTITDFIETDSNLFFFGWDNTSMYLYTIDKFSELNVRMVDSFIVKNGDFTTFWTFTDPKSSFFVVSVGLTTIDSNYFYVANKYRMNIIRKDDGAPSGFVNRDAGALVNNRFILWDGTKYEIYDNVSLLNTLECGSGSCNIDYLSAFKYNDTIVIGAGSFGSETLIEKLYISAKDSKKTSTCTVLNDSSVNAFYELKTTDSCIYYCPKITDNVIFKKLWYNGVEDTIYDRELKSKNLVIAHLQKDIFVIQYTLNEATFFDLLDLRLNRTLENIIIPTSRQIVIIEPSNCGGYFVFTQAKGGGRIGGFYYLDINKDSAFLIEELEYPAYTHPLGDIPEIYEEHDRLYFYRENYAGWFTLAYYELSDVCKKVKFRDKTVLYPNPAHDQLYLTTKQTSVTIYNSIGQLLLRDVQTEWNSEQYIDISDLADGVYYLMLNNQVLRFIKQ